MWLKVLTVIAVCFVASTADACPRCGLFGNRCALRQNVVVQPFSVHQYAYPQQISYFVGQPIRVEAIVQKALADDPQYKEFQAFRAWKSQQSELPTQTQRRELPASTLVQKCATCHSGDAPKKGLLLDGTAKLTSDQALQAMRAVQDGSMPPKGTLSPKERGDVWQELIGLVEVKP